MEFHTWDIDITNNISDVNIRETDFYELVSQSVINLLYFDKNNTYLPFYTDSRIAAAYTYGLMFFLFLLIINISLTYNSQIYTDKSINFLENIHIRSLEARIEKTEDQLKARIQALETELKDLQDYVAMYCGESD